jgi:phospholipid-binding lipoprotein MlaA
MTPTTGKHLVACLAVSGLLLGGCGARPPIVEGDKPEEPVFPADYVLQDDVEYIEKIKDPWQGLNRGIYRFNYRFDQYVLLPAVIGYKKITPNFVEKGLHNFFTNFTNFTRIFNCILQGSPRKTIDTTGRLLVNTTVGIGGLLDPATAMGIPQHYEDFGQTLGVWGVPTGPYLVVPLFGPSNVRDATGLFVDWRVYSGIRKELFNFDNRVYIPWGILLAIDTRAHVNFLYYQTGSPWEYELVRTLYTTKRELDIEK